MSLIRFPLTNRGDSRMALSTSSHVSKVIRAKSALPGPFLLSGIWTAVTYRISGEKRTYMSITIEMALKLLRSDGCVQTSNERTTGTGRIRMTVTVIPAVIVTGGGRRRKRRRLAHRTARRIVVAVLHVSVVRIHGGAPHGVGHGVVGGGASVAVVIVVIIGTGSITRRVLRLVHHRGGNGLGRVIDARGSRAGGIGAGSRIITHVGLRGLVGSVAVAVVAGLVLGMEGVAATRVGRVIITVVVSVVTGRTIIIVVITTVVIATIIIATVIIASVVITAVVITAIVVASVVIATIVIATMIIVVVVPRALVGG